MSELLMLKKVKIGGIKYDIVFPYKTETNKNLIGMHVLSSSQIYIIDEFDGYKLSWCKIHETLLHEILHGISNVYCNNVECEGISHSSITKISIGLYQVIRDNNLNIKNFVDYPKQIKVGGFTYDIIKDFKFADEPTTVWFDIKQTRTKLYFSGERDGEINSNDFKASLFCMGLLYAICGVYLAEDEDVPLIANMNSFGQGIQQVLKDNNIEKMIKNGIKADKKRRGV